MPLLLFLSAPVDFRPYSALAMPWREYRAFQPLFGFDAQLAAFASLAEQAGHHPVFLPMPEMVASPPSLRMLARKAGVEAGALRDSRHLRFGPPHTAHLLKPARNIAVIAGAPAAGVVDLGRHPFAAGDRLPHLFAAVLGYGDGGGAISTLTGTVLDARVLPDPFVTGDLARGGDAIDAPAARYRADPTLFDVESLAEWRKETWVAGAPPPGLSADFVAALDRGDAPALVPWNLAHPGTAIPDIAGKLVRHGGADAGSAIVLFPYNATMAGLADLERWVVHWRTQASPMLSRVFLGRLRDISRSRALPHFFRLAWLDAAGDPEAAWTRRRLAAVGMPMILLDRAAAADTPADPAIVSRIAADQRLDTYARDTGGTRLVRGRTLSVQGVADLLRRSAALAGRPSASPPPSCATALPPGYFEALLAPRAHPIPVRP